jgi:hypothetical protein
LLRGKLRRGAHLEEPLKPVAKVSTGHVDTPSLRTQRIFFPLM